MGEGETQLTIFIRICALTRFQEDIDVIYREGAIGHCEGEAGMLKNVIS